MKISPMEALIQDAVLANLTNILLNLVSNTDIDRIFASIDAKDMAPKRDPWTAKRERIYTTLAHYQITSRSPRHVHRFIEEAMHPGQYSENPGYFEEIRSALNEQLSFVSLQVSREGKVVVGNLAKTLDEAAILADSIIVELKRRHVHPNVLKACDKELLQKNLFHGLLEANKSLTHRLRNATGQTGDGAPLADKVFGQGSGTPLIALNSLQTETERTQHAGFHNLVKGCFGMWRNLTAHELRSSTDLQRNQVLDAMTTISYIHKQLDEAVVTLSGGKVP